MIQVEEIDGGLRVVDAAKNEVEIEIEDWELGGEAMEIDRDVEEVLSGVAQGITLPSPSVVIESTEHNGLLRHPVADTRDFPDGCYLLQFDGAIVTYVSVESGYRLESDVAADNVTLTLDDSQPLTLGFRSQEELPSLTLTIPKTAQGAAAAISTFGEAHKTDTPDRSYPSMRRHPPLVEFDDELNAQDLPDRLSEPSVEIHLPDSLESVFPATPLAFYLDAEVNVRSDRVPSIVTSGTYHEFENPDALHLEISEILRQVFFLDCLVRNSGPYGMDLQELALFEELPFDPDGVYPLPPGKRLAEYLAIPFEKLSDRLPDWPLTVSIEPTWANISALSYLAHRMALVLPPESESVDMRSFLDQSMAGRIRSETTHNTPLSLDGSKIVDPSQSIGLMHGWMAEGITVDGFNTSPEAFANRARFLNTSNPLSLLVILNDRDMGLESSTVLKTYRERGEFSSSDVHFFEDVNSDELAELLEGSFDFLHYIGHCAAEGIRCSDGYLSPSELSECNVQTFFLNACKSYRIGEELVRLGSIAGAVTIGDILDEQAMKVGAIFSMLICSGHSIERSLWMSRTQAILNRQYTVVGDGTHTLTSSRDVIPTVLQVSKEGPDGYRTRLISSSPNYHGSIYQAHTSPKPVLCGNEIDQVISEERFEWLLSNSEQPYIYDDDFFWPDELLDELF